MAGAADAILLCGTTIAFQTGFLAEILEVSELGADRRAVDATTGNSPNGWGEVLYSCIARLVPFTVTIAFNPAKDWKTAIKAVKAEIVITFPIPGGEPEGESNTLTFDGAMTGFRIRGQLEERMMATATITPTGEPTLG